MFRFVLWMSLCLSLTSAYGTVSNVNHVPMLAQMPASVQKAAQLHHFAPAVMQQDLATFLTLTPEKYRVLTGEKMGMRKAWQLKMAQKMLKKQILGKGGAQIDKPIYIILAILGLGWVGMGLNDDWQGSDWVICLLLYFLFWLPGFIYSLIKMSKYY